MIFTSLVLTILVNLMDFFYLYLLPKTDDVSICNIISPVFWLGIISDSMLKNCIKLYLYWISFSSNMNIGGIGGSYWPTQNKSPSKSPALESCKCNKMIKHSPFLKNYNCVHVWLFHNFILKLWKWHTYT